MDPIENEIEGTDVVQSDIQLPATGPEGTWAGLTLVLALILTQVAKKLPKVGAVIKPIIPAIAVLVAVGIRAALAATIGEEFSAAVLIEGISAGAGAVLAHSQWRSVTKHISKAKDPPEA